MVGTIDPAKLRDWLADGGEVALFDVREAGQFGERHMLFAVPAAYSGFELVLPRLAPSRAVRLVLVDGGDGVAAAAARRADALGYRNVFVLAGGIDAWAEAGHPVYAGVFVPSKAFGELVEIERATPRIGPRELRDRQAAGDNLVVVDGRPFEEFTRFSIPGGICCPNGELALRIADIAPDPATTIVVNCAGRTRSIIGAQTLIDLAVPNPVVALENGTQGWVLAGLDLVRGARDRHGFEPAGDLDARRARAAELLAARGGRAASPDEVAGWLADTGRTTYLFDIRTPEEHAADGPRGFVGAPGGQLVQASDQWIGVRGARVVVADGEMIRAPVIAAWLRQLGHEAYVLAGGNAAMGKIPIGEVGCGTLGGGAAAAPISPLAEIDAASLVGLVGGGHAQVIDLRSSAAYRAGHIAGAIWSIRPRIMSCLGDPGVPVVLVSEDPALVALAARDLGEAGAADVRHLGGGVEAWRAAGHAIEASPGTPADGERIDFLFFTHGRVEGNLDASRQYLAWETGLPDQLDAAERAAFTITPAP